MISWAGIVCTRDYDLVKDRSTLLSDVMTTEVITLADSCTFEDATSLLKVPRARRRPSHLQDSVFGARVCWTEESGSFGHEAPLKWAHKCVQSVVVGKEVRRYCLVTRVGCPSWKGVGLIPKTPQV